VEEKMAKTQLVKTGHELVPFSKHIKKGDAELKDDVLDAERDVKKLRAQKNREAFDIRGGILATLRNKLNNLPWAQLPFFTLLFRGIEGVFILFFSFVLGLIEYQMTLLSVLFVLGTFSENVSIFGVQAGLEKLVAVGLVCGMTGLAHLGLSHLFIKKDAFEGTINFKLTSSEQSKKIAILILSLFVLLCIANSVLAYMRQVEIREGEIAMESGRGGSGMSPIVVGVLTLVTSLGTGLLFFFGFYPVLLMFVGILTKISIAVLSLILFFSIPRKKKLEYREEAPDKQTEVEKKKNRLTENHTHNKTRKRVLMAIFMILSITLISRADDLIVIVLDMSGSFKSEYQDARDSIVRLIRVVEPPCQLSGLIISEESFKDTSSFFDLILRGAASPIEKHKSGYINMINGARSAAIQKIQEMPFLQSETTDVYGSFFLASRILNNTTADRKFLVIFSDMLHNTKKKLTPVDCQGAHVLCLYFRIAGAEKDFMDRLNFWKSYFQQCQAASVKILEPTLSSSFNFNAYFDQKEAKR
jgi:hypothetical protein